MLHFKGRSQDKVTLFHVVEGKVCLSSSELPWLVALSVYYFGHRLAVLLSALLFFFFFFL